MTATPSQAMFNHPMKNVLFAVAMVLFLALSFKLTGDLTAETTSISQTDSVVSTLQAPNTPTTQAVKAGE